MIASNRSGEFIRRAAAIPPQAAKRPLLDVAPDYRQLFWYTLSTVMLTTLAILLIVSFP